MSPDKWGPPTWEFMHTLVEKVKWNPNIGQQLISILMQISSHLPCPECTQHAKEFWRYVQKDNIKGKEDLINLLYVFHNKVNVRKKKIPFKYTDLSKYKGKQLIKTYLIFRDNFHTHGNMNLINESFHREAFKDRLNKWMISNIRNFNIT